MVRLTGAVLLLLFLPGALAMRLPFGDRPRRAALAAEERAFWAVVLSASWSVLVVLALAAFGAYRFERLLVANGALAAILLIGLRGRLGYGTKASALSWSGILPVLLIAAGCWLYFPPAEYVMGGKDPGTYVNEGIQIAQRGSLFIDDETVAAVPAAFRDLFFPSFRVPWYYSVRFMGFFVTDPARGTVVGQFPHWFPASVAIGYGLNGLSGARQAVGAWAILGLLAVYFAGARLFGRTAAFAGTALLAVNVIEVWFARYPNSEVAMQAMLFAAILAFGRALDGDRRFFGPIAGALVGLQLFLRYDVLIAAAAFGAACALLPYVGARIGRGFVAALGLTAAAGWWYVSVPMRAYSVSYVTYTRDRGGWWLLGAAVLAVLVVRRLARVEGWARAVRRLVPVALGLAVAALALYAYFLRQQGGRLALADAMAFRTFGWYILPIGVLLAVAAFAVLSVRAFWRDPAFFLTTAAFGIFFFYKTRIVPDHFWSTRRFLAAVLPGAMLLIGGLAAELLGSAGLTRLRAWSRRPGPVARAPSWVAVVGAVLVVAAVAPLGAAFWRATAPVHAHVEYAGLIPKLEQLQARIGAEDLLLVESRRADSDLHVLALPLAYVYARHVLVLSSNLPDKRALEGFVSWARSRYREIYFLGGGGTDLLTRSISVEPVLSDRFQVPEYDSPFNAYPRGVRRKEFDFGLYRLVPGDTTRPSGPIVLDVGKLDDLNVVRFHAKERRVDTGMLFRWTKNLSWVLLLGMSPEARLLTLWLGTGGRPQQAPPPDVEVSLDGRVLGTVRPLDAIQPYRFDLPPDLVAAAARKDDPARLQLRVSTWNPHTVLGVGDTRELGVIVTRVAVE